jgi:hypothetical protein
MKTLYKVLIFVMVLSANQAYAGLFQAADDAATSATNATQNIAESTVQEPAPAAAEPTSTNAQTITTQEETLEPSVNEPISSASVANIQ